MVANRGAGVHHQRRLPASPPTSTTHVDRHHHHPRRPSSPPPTSIVVTTATIDHHPPSNAVTLASSDVRVSSIVAFHDCNSTTLCFSASTSPFPFSNATILASRFHPLPQLVHFTLHRRDLLVHPLIDLHLRVHVRPVGQRVVSNVTPPTNLATPSHNRWTPVFL